MRRIFTTVLLFTATLMSYSQSLGYQDLAILFAQNDNNGTARFTAMSGAFGALGGDVSSIHINPAGLSVFSNSMFNATFNSRNTLINSTYYGNTLTTENEFFNLSQAGGVLVFNSAYSGDWSKFALGFNYRITNDFNNVFLAQGNSGVATFTEFPLDDSNNPIQYDIADEQQFRNVYRGELTELNIGFSSVYQNRLHIGGGLNFYDLNFSQQADLFEFNSSSGGETLDASLYQENFVSGTGFSANLGFIYKANQAVRFGASYQTPTWFTEIYEESNITNNDGFFGDTVIEVSNDNRIYDNTAGGFFPTQSFFYRLRNPGKLTLSGALVFGKSGLLSVDYSIKNYRNIRLSGADFSVENQFIQDNLRNTNNLNIGGEWRLNRFSIRGGYAFEQSPDKFALESDNIQSYSLGAGYDFGSLKFDLAYSDSNRTSPYNFYPGFNVEPTNLEINNKVITATISLSL